MSTTTTAQPNTLVGAQVSGLDCLIRTLVSCPEIAPFLKNRLGDIHVPLGSFDNPSEVMHAVGSAFAANGAAVTATDDAGFTGLSVLLPGNAVGLWLFMPPADVEAAVVDVPQPAEPAAPVESAAGADTLPAVSAA